MQGCVSNETIAFRHTLHSFYKQEVFMKILHMADLHIGKRVNGFSMLEDQKMILQEILEIAEREKADVIIIAGDVYDRSIPPEEAVDLFDQFLVELSNQKRQVFIISGNHDSAERVAFGGRLMGQSGIHISPVYDGNIEPYYLEDAWGKVAFWMISFIKPAHVKRYSGELEISSYTDALQYVVSQFALREDERNIAITHQFLTGAAVSDSEDIIMVGGTEEVDARVFDAFDYVALGHLHRPQKVGKECIRYAGSPLKYSFSECNHEKSVTVLELGEKGKTDIRTIPLHPVRDMVRIKGFFAQLMEREETLTDYCEITLLDEEDIPNAISRLRGLYPNFMQMLYDNTRTRSQENRIVNESSESKSPMELFEELYHKQNGQAVSQEQKEYLHQLIEELWEEKA